MASDAKRKHEGGRVQWWRSEDAREGGQIERILDNHGFAHYMQKELVDVVWDTDRNATLRRWSYIGVLANLHESSINPSGG